MSPDRVEFTVGETVHKQPVKLIREQYMGIQQWTIRQEALNQRDESSTIRGLTAEVIIAMAEAVKWGAK